MPRTRLGVILLLAASPAVGQVAPPIPNRYGLAADVEAYPQATPQQALASTVRALERNRIEYFAAHLLDPAFADARVADRARVLEPEVEHEFRHLRDRQRATTPAGARLPSDPAGLAAAVKAEAGRRAFRVFVQDVRGMLAENPDHLRELQRFGRDATFAETGDAAKATVPDLKGREVFFKRTPHGWTVQDQRQEPAAK